MYTLPSPLPCTTLNYLLISIDTLPSPQPTYLFIKVQNLHVPFLRCSWWLHPPLALPSLLWFPEGSIKCLVLVSVVSCFLEEKKKGLSSLWDRISSATNWLILWVGYTGNHQGSLITAFEFDLWDYASMKQKITCRLLSTIHLSQSESGSQHNVNARTSLRFSRGSVGSPSWKQHQQRVLQCF